MKKLLVVALALVMALACVSAMAEPLTLVYAEVNPLDTIVGQTDTFFAEKVAELENAVAEQKAKLEAEIAELKATIAAIEAAIAELDYRVNPFARSLKTQRSRATPPFSGISITRHWRQLREFESYHPIAAGTLTFPSCNPLAYRWKPSRVWLVTRISI